MDPTHPPIIGALFDGPLDLVGDVHGEWSILCALLQQLGYDADGRHPDGRRLVFLGDLGDRGPDSPSVYRWVSEAVSRGRAQCVMGNHELNLLRGDSKPGNRWYLDPDHPEHGVVGPEGARSAAEFRHSARATPGDRARIAPFLGSLPLALLREDLRVVHAAWDAAAIASLRALPGPAMAAFDHFEADLATHLAETGLAEAARAERLAHAHLLTDRAAASVPFLGGVARLETLEQMHNPVRVLTSGPEAPVAAPFWASGRWRMVQRVRWWHGYDDPTPVVVGHYWRKAALPAPEAPSEPDLFDGEAPHVWVGPRQSVFCVDFSIGARYRDPGGPDGRFETRLAALRWPERTLVFDDGQVCAPDDG